MYGLDVLGFTEMEARDRADPMAVVFPKVGSTFNLFISINSGSDFKELELKTFSVFKDFFQTKNSYFFYS